MLKREVSQEDARRTIVALTAEGRTYVDRVHDIKQDVLSTALADWPAEDIAEFARLYNRFMLSMEQQANAFDDEQSKSS
jgi:DNA-binding MarR family transcriptional regulator